MRRVFSVFLKIISHFTFFSFIFFIFIFTPGFLSSSYKFVSFSNLNFPSFLDSNSNLNSDSNSNSDLNSITLSEISDRIDIPSNFSNDKIKLNRPLFSVGEFQAGKEKELDEKSIVAESALVMDYKTGDILWEKNSTKKMFPASLTKIMTSIVAIENAKDLNELVRISKNASGKNHSSFGFRVGDRISVLDLIKAALICSHNNATIALAEHISGSEEEFVKLMNLKAKEIGATHTLFQNTNGLDFESFYHKTTAQDLALITSYCLRNEIFRRIVSTSKDYISINGKEIEINNTNDLLSYEYIKGVKTGYTENAGFCLILYSEKNDIELIVVILNSSQEG
ncbi:MAG: D-alanyl-D-alanine carboxypeptidase, partial [Actinobacteria bacterium]|nr:D-alanyl-D-alanine carboxypeptidase [Actinomycetota bacterium]